VTRLAPWHAALLASVPGIALAAAPMAAPAAFAPPCGQPLLLSRTIVRELADGKAIVATRRYRVTFTRLDAGWRLDGELVASEIDVPPPLAALAAIEKARPDEGLFPIMLDSAGLIVSSASGGPQERAAVEKAAALAARKRSGGSSPIAPEILAAIAKAAADGSAGRTPWPRALFVPGALSGASEQRVPLADGGEGVVRVELASAPAAGLATMGSASRRVVTEIGGTRRVAREEWTLAALDTPAKP